MSLYLLNAISLNKLCQPISLLSALLSGSVISAGNKRIISMANILYIYALVCRDFVWTSRESLASVLCAISCNVDTSAQ